MLPNGQEMKALMNETLVAGCYEVVGFTLKICRQAERLFFILESLMPVVFYNKLHTWFTQKSYADCAIRIVCIFGLTGEVFSQNLVDGNICETLNF